jgi:3-oxoacid CoA-transferase
MATAAKTTIVECEHLVEVGEIDPDQVHLPSIFVQRSEGPALREVDSRSARCESAPERRRPHDHGSHSVNRSPTASPSSCSDWFYVNLGIGLPTLVANYIPRDGHPPALGERTARDRALAAGGQEDPDLINAGKETVTG